MKKEWFFDRFCGMRTAVAVIDGKIAEVGIESETSPEVTGNIYKARVQNVVAGMQAAFLACGMEKNVYLPLNESTALFQKYDGAGGTGESLDIREQDELLVQIVKPPRGSKGAKVSVDLSFVGKNLIYLPRTDFLGISRKITDETVRAALLMEADKLREKGEGLIVRTAGENATKRQMKTEYEYLKRVCRNTMEKAKKASVGQTVYEECTLAVKMLRDSLGDDISRITVGDPELFYELRSLAALRPDLGEKKVVLHEGGQSMFRKYGIDEQIYELTKARVRLEKGGEIVIDRTEAMTVIDVNTGKYTGDSDLETTVFETNLIAAREIARQVRLRNLAGIVAVDFIDMTEAEHREKVNLELEKALLSDRAKSRVLPMSDLCVTLFTRKRTTNDIASFLLKPCSSCTREGFVLSDRYIAMRLRSDILDYFANGYEAVIIELNRSVMEHILAEGYYQKDLKEGWKEKRIYMIPHRTYHEERYEIRGDNNPVLTLPDDAQLLY